MARVRYMNKNKATEIDIGQYPNFSATGSITGMKRQYYGRDALLVRSGRYIYRVPSNIYNLAH